MEALRQTQGRLSLNSGTQLGQISSERKRKSGEKVFGEHSFSCPLLVHSFRQLFPNLFLLLLSQETSSRCCSSSCWQLDRLFALALECSLKKRHKLSVCLSFSAGYSFGYSFGYCLQWSPMAVSSHRAFETVSSGQQCRASDAERAATSSSSALRAPLWPLGGRQKGKGVHLAACWRPKIRAHRL